MDNIAENPLQKHTPGHLNCPACARANEMLEVLLTPQMTFAEAFGIWIKRRVIDYAGVWSNARYISKRTERDLHQYKRALEKFFGAMRLEEIHLGHLREYQRARAVCDKSCGAWDRPTGANLIRKEIQCLIRILKASGVWTPKMDEDFEPLQPVDNDVPRAMTPEEQHCWLHTAAGREAWRAVYWWSIVALQTTAATNEMRSLRLGDIYLNQGTLQIRREGAKNKYRVRTIPLSTPEVVWALGGLMERAARMGSTEPFHYLFPLHITAKRYDPLQPMGVSGLYKQWDAVRKASGLQWLRIYDLRHTAITRMAEAGMPIHVIMSFAGHVTEQMQRHYTTVSMQAKRRWAAAAWGNAEMPYMPAMPTWNPEPSRAAAAQPPTWARQAAS